MCTEQNSQWYWYRTFFLSLSLIQALSFASQQFFHNTFKLCGGFASIVGSILTYMYAAKVFKPKKPLSGTVQLFSTTFPKVASLASFTAKVDALLGTVTFLLSAIT